MQRIFRKYAVIIITSAVFAILIINYVIASFSTNKQQVATFKAKINQIIHTVQENQVELKAIQRNLDEDYLTRARAAAYVIDQNPEIVEDVEELQNLSVLLNVDEIHVIDENGIIAYSSVPEYIGLDFHEGEQTREFLSLLLDEDGENYLIQKEQPNTAEQKIMKYVGVTRRGVHGIIQVGLQPVRLEEAQERNSYKYIFNRFPTDKGEEFFAIDSSTGKVVADTGDLPQNALEQKYADNALTDCENGSFMEIGNKETLFVVTRQYNDVLIGASISKRDMMAGLWKNMCATMICLLIVEIIMIIFLNALVSKRHS